MSESKPKLKVLDLFSGILVGGFSLGLERTGGFETVAFCEIEEFPRKVLRKHWPDVPIYEDVRELTAERLAADGITVDVITGGFPCQDISIAGSQKGINSETRSGLWSEIIRLSCELRPQYIIVENVANLLSGPNDNPGKWFSRILGDLATIRYDAEWENIPAAAVGASHRRERVWLVAYPDKNKHSIYGKSRQGRFTQESHRGDLFNIWEKWRTEPRVDRMVDGVPGSMDRCAALGNAVVPQIPEIIGHAILHAEGRA